MLGFGDDAAFCERGADGNCVPSQRHVRNHLELPRQNFIHDSLVGFNVVAFPLSDEGYNMPVEGVACHHDADFNVADCALFAAGQEDLLYADLAFYVGVEQ